MDWIDRVMGRAAAGHRHASLDVTPADKAAELRRKQRRDEQELRHLEWQYEQMAAGERKREDR